MTLPFPSMIRIMVYETRCTGFISETSSSHLPIPRDRDQEGVWWRVRGRIAEHRQLELSLLILNQTMNDKEGELSPYHRTKKQSLFYLGGQNGFD